MTSLREHLEYCGRSDVLAQLRRCSPESYDDFMDILYEDLDVLIGFIEADAKDFHDASEDALNREVVRLLKARHYHASHDHDEGGHVDIRVSSPDGKYSWLAEAKLDNGPKYLEGGVHQLTGRYSRGTPGHECGGFVVYIQKAKCAERFATWREYMIANEKNWEALELSDCPRRPGLAFNSQFVLPRIGEGAPKYKIRHIAVSAFRDPKPT